MIDVRCNARTSSDEVASRCQLFAGHTSLHAVLTVDNADGRSGRAIRTWCAESSDLLPADHASTFCWAPGFPALEEALDDVAPDVPAVSELARTPLLAEARTAPVAQPRRRSGRPAAGLSRV